MAQVPTIPSVALSMIQNETGIFFLSVFEYDGVTPQSLVGAELWFHGEYNNNGFEINKNSPSSGITIQNAAGGANCATLQIEPGDTTALNLLPGAVVSMQYQLNLQSGSESYPLVAGTLTVTGNVGTP
jgi:hypothetical protein